MCSATRVEKHMPILPGADAAPVHKYLCAMSADNNDPPGVMCKLLNPCL